jgi:hypothetical protein
MSHEPGYELVLVFAFRDQSPSFTYGFICGQIWQEMETRKATFTRVVPSALREDVIAMATNSGWSEKITDLNKYWIDVEFTRACT